MCKVGAEFYNYHENNNLTTVNSYLGNFTFMNNEREHTFSTRFRHWNPSNYHSTSQINGLKISCFSTSSMESYMNYKVARIFKSYKSVRCSTCLAHMLNNLPTVSYLRESIFDLISESELFRGRLLTSFDIA